jgi:hypothetical protein
MLVRGGFILFTSAIFFILFKVKECNKSINYAVKAKEVHWCGFCYETDIRNNIEYCVDNCAKGTIEYEGNCYLPDNPIIENIKDLNEICKSLCVKDKSNTCNKENMSCSCINNNKGLYCEFDENTKNIVKALESINRYTYNNDDFMTKLF